MPSVLNVIQTMAGIYRQEMTEDQYEAYGMVLGKLTPEQVQRMMATCMSSTERFLPPPGVLLEMAGAGPLNPDEEAELAWAELSQALGGRDTRSLPERTRRCLKQIGGANYLMELSIRDCDFKRTQFLRLYKAYRKTHLIECKSNAEQIGCQKRIGVTGGYVEPHEESLASLAGTTLTLKDGSEITAKERS